MSDRKPLTFTCRLGGRPVERRISAMCGFSRARGRAAARTTCAEDIRELASRSSAARREASVGVWALLSDADAGRLAMMSG